jgi:leucyl-tRNA synthetase
VTDDIATLNFNTAISQMMIFVNEFLNLEVKPRAAMETFVLLLSPFAPHICEELWSMLGHAETLAYHRWPEADPSKLKVDTFDLVVQVNGKVRAKFPVPMDLDDAEVEKLAVANDAVARHLDGKKIEKVVVVRNKLASIVAR